MSARDQGWKIAGGTIGLLLRNGVMIWAALEVSNLILALLLWSLVALSALALIVKAETGSDAPSSGSPVHGSVVVKGAPAEADFRPRRGGGAA